MIEQKQFLIKLYLYLLFVDVPEIRQLKIPINARHWTRLTVIGYVEESYE